MNVTIDEIMIRQVMTATPHQTCEHVRDLIHSHTGSCIPVVDPEGEPIGIVSAADFVEPHPPAKPVSHIMTKKVYSVPQYADVSLAARIMRKHKIHHVVVTHEQKVVGIVSSFDLLKLVEGHRFVMKNAPDQSSKRMKKSLA